MMTIWDITMEEAEEFAVNESRFQPRQLEIVDGSLTPDIMLNVCNIFTD